MIKGWLNFYIHPTTRELTISCIIHDTKEEALKHREYFEIIELIFIGEPYYINTETNKKRMYMISEEKTKELLCPFNIRNICKGSECMAWVHVDETINSIGNTVSVGYCKLIGDI